MHEMGIVAEIIKLTEEQAKAEGAEKVNRLVVQLGQASSVVPQLLKTCFKMAIKNTMLEDSKLEIEIIPDSREIILKEIQIKTDSAN